jgi:hypothetical protein
MRNPRGGPSTAMQNVRCWGQSGHGFCVAGCLLLTHNVRKDYETIMMRNRGAPTGLEEGSESAINPDPRPCPDTDDN